MITLLGYKLNKSKLTEDDIENLKNKLTVKPKMSKDFEDTVEKYCILRESKNNFYLPRYFGINAYGLEQKFDNCLSFNCNKIETTFKGSLRNEQLDIINNIMPKIYSAGGGIISLPCGYGKTVLALYILSKLNLKTIILVHKTFLQDQWIQRIKEFIPNASVGIIKQNIIDTNNDITIGMIQSLSMKNYDKKLLKGFGLIIVDECHHIAAKVFYQCLNKINAKYTLGLSATPIRKDGLTKVIKWYLGDFIYKIDNEVNTKTKVYKINFYIDNPELFVEKKMMFNGKHIINIPKMVTNLTKIKERNNIIINVILYYITQKRNILLLSGRIEHLHLLKNIIDKTLQENNNKDIITSLYTGSVSKESRQFAEQNSNLIFASYSMAHEGLDIPRLNTIILATPQNDVTQSIGRIMRTNKINEHNIINPHIIDICDELSIFNSYNRKRNNLYDKNEYLSDVLYSDGTRYNKNHIGDSDKLSDIKLDAFFKK